MPRQTPDKNNSLPEKFLAKKSLGQNFLTSDVVPRWMTAAVTIKPCDTVVEVGPGTGVLTKELLKTGAKVIAIETDTRAMSLLAETFTPALKNKTLTLIKADIKEVDLTSLGLKAGQYQVVANIPYYLSGFLLRLFLEADCFPANLVFLMQKEVVNRIVRDKKESILSLSVKAFGEVSYIKTVTKGHFNPQPKVDSAILAVTNISHHHFSTTCPQTLFFHLLHIGFGQKRKQLMTNLSQEYERSDLEAIFRDLGIMPTARAETISLPTWLALTRALKKLAN